MSLAIKDVGYETVIVWLVVQVKAKYKARAKYFQCRVDNVEQCNARLVSELTSARQALHTRYQTTAAATEFTSSSSCSPGCGAAAAGPTAT